MKIAYPHSDPKLYIWLVIEGFLDFMKYIAKIELKEIYINVETETINYIGEISPLNYIISRNGAG